MMPRVPWLLLTAAFFLRLGVGLSQHYGGYPFAERPTRDWWNTGYTHYGRMAVDLAEGKGLRLVTAESGVWRAMRPPLYPLLLAALYKGFGKSTLAALILHALIGTGTVWLGFLIARSIAGPREGKAAAIMAMAYPYYVGHDTALQETALLTFLTAFCVHQLLAAAESGGRRDALLAGTFLGLVVLCKQTLLAFAPLALIWLFLACRVPRRKALENALAMGLAAFLVLAPWLERNRRVVGSPVVSTGFGGFLWAGTNDIVLEGYPGRSIDHSVSLALRSIPADLKTHLDGMGELERDRWYSDRAGERIREKPGWALALAGVKIKAAFSPWINPRDGGRLRMGLHAIGYVPLLLLAFYSLLHWKSDWRAPTLFGLLGLSFVGTSVFAFAHTSHRTYLDVYLMVLASAPAARLLSLGSKTAA